MPPDKNGICIRILLHSLLEARCQILFKRRILNDRYLQRIKEPQHAFSLASRYSLNLLNVANLKATLRSLLTLDKEGYEDRPLGMGMDAAPRTTVESSQEEGRAGGWFEFDWFADILAR